MAHLPFALLRFAVIAAVCSEKIQFLLKRIELLTMQSCRGRVIAFLLAHGKEGGEVIFRGSREDLARHLGVSRAALFRELAALQTMGAIESHGNLFHVMDPGQLEDLLYHPSCLCLRRFLLAAPPHPRNPPSLRHPLIRKLPPPVNRSRRKPWM